MDADGEAASTDGETLSGDGGLRMRIERLRPEMAVSVKDP